MDTRVLRFAKLLVDYSVNVKPGDKIALMSSPAAAPAVLAVYEGVLARGGYPTVSIELPGMQEIYYRNATDEQLKYLDPVRKMAIESYDGIINLRALGNTRELSGIDPARQTLRSKASQSLLQTYMARGATGELKWCSTLYPTPSSAQEADMSLRDYEDFVFAACYCDKDDPIAEWMRIHDEQERVIAWLKGRDKVQVKGVNADLTLSIKGRTFANSDGHHNMPSGEVFTGPVENSANGWVRFTYPSVTAGREVEGIELEFADGEVVKASAKKNEEYLHRMLDTDEGSRYLGEFAIGTNFGIQKFTKNILFDEKIGGSFHMAVGAGYPDTGSKNQSAIHWDMICDMREDGEIWVDNELLYQKGQFVIE